MPQAKHLNITQVTSVQLFSWSSSSRSPSPLAPSPSSPIFSFFCFFNTNSTFFSANSRVFVICAPLSWQALVTWWLISMVQDPNIITATNDDDGNPHSCFLGEDGNLLHCCFLGEGFSPSHQVITPLSRGRYILLLLLLLPSILGSTSNTT